MTPLRQLALDTMLLRGYAERTQYSYLSAINRLAQHYHKSPAHLSPEEIQNYFLHNIKERHWSPATCRLAINAFHFLYIDVLKWEKTKFIFDLPRREQRIPELLTQQEVSNILAYTKNFRQKTMLSLCYGCGLRVSELVGIRVIDIDSERHLLKITQGKGRKDRQVILPEELIQQLRQCWLQYRSPKWLFNSINPQKHLNVGTAQKYYQGAKKRAKITKVGGIHALRHYATHQLMMGMPINMLQEQLGHKDTRCTMRYLHWVPNYAEGQYRDLLLDVGGYDNE